MTKKELESIEILVDQYRQDLIADIERRKRINLIGNSNDKYEYYRDCISDYFGMPKEKAFNIKSREDTVMFCRHLLAWICRVGETSLPYSMQYLSELIGYKAHSSVHHSISEMEARLHFTHNDRMTVNNILEMMGYELVKENDNYTNKLKDETIPS
jgi:chromosomal replication initiation ATPase DnaA